MGNMELLATALEYMETHLEEDVRTEDVAFRIGADEFVLLTKLSEGGSFFIL